VIDLSTPEERDAAAGEYVLGTLNDADRDAFAAALARDEALLTAVYAWQDRLLSLSAHAVPVAPPAALWERLSRSVEAMQAGPADARAPEPAPEGATPPRAVRPRAAPAAPRWWQRVAAWQGIGAVALAAAAFMAVLLVQRVDFGAAPPARYLAVLQSPADRSTGWVVEVETGGRVRLVALPGAAAAGPGQALQFWTKPQGADAPTSLGLVRAGATIDLPASRLPAVGEQQLFEITLEPEQGSPIGRPTGPILYVGRSVRL